MLAYVEATLACLRWAGFNLALADQAWNLLDAYTYGFTFQQVNFPFATSDYRSAAMGYLDGFPSEAYPVFYQLARMVADGRHSGVQDFEFGLQIVLEGLESRLGQIGGKQ